jgi:hypothetical protein
MACNLGQVGDVELHQHAMTPSLHWLLQNPPHTTCDFAALVWPMNCSGCALVDSYIGLAPSADSPGSVNSIIYLVGLVVVVLFILSFLGLH